MMDDLESVNAFWVIDLGVWQGNCIVVDVGEAGKQRVVWGRAGCCRGPGIDRERAFATVAESFARRVVAAHTRHKAGVRGVRT